MMLPLLLFLVIQAATCIKASDYTPAIRGHVVSKDSEKISSMGVQRFDEAEDLMELGLLNYMETVTAQRGDMGVYTEFLELMTAAGETETLTSSIGITLLAPSDDSISQNMKDFLLASENAQILQLVMNYHMIPSVVSFISPIFQHTINGIATTTVQSVAGDMVQLSLDQNGFYVNGVINALSYALTNESILYRIDRLLIPPSMNGLIPEELLVENSQAKEFIPADITYEFPIVIPSDFFIVSENTSSEPVSGAQSMIPVDIPSTAPSSSPKSVISVAPSFFLPDQSSPEPLGIGSDAPSLTPSDAPSISPSDAPSISPSDAPSISPSDAPSFILSDVPSILLSDVPSSISSEVPSSIPSSAP